MGEVQDAAAVVFFSAFAWWVNKLTDQPKVLLVAMIAAVVLAVIALVRLVMALNARRSSE